MPVSAITSMEQFKSVINDKDSASVIDFWATWCGPCKMMSPVYAKLSETAEFKALKFYKIDAEELPEALEECGVRNMPTFFAVFGGTRKVSVGANPQNLKNLLKEFADLKTAASAETSED